MKAKKKTVCAEGPVAFLDFCSGLFFLGRENPTTGFPFIPHHPSSLTSLSHTRKRIKQPRIMSISTAGRMVARGTRSHLHLPWTTCVRLQGVQGGQGGQGARHETIHMLTKPSTPTLSCN